MPRPLPRPLPFVLAATDHGPMIVSRLDFAQDRVTGNLFGVGAQLLSTGAYDPDEVAFGVELLENRRETHGDGVVAIDCGANVGVHAVSWATQMTGWGELIAFEPQERLFYALAGNLALANAFNARAVWAAVGATSGKMPVPRPNYLKAGSLGSVELSYDSATEYVGQAISYEPGDLDSVMVVALDDLDLPRLDLLKVDVERMEVDVLTGARRTIEKCRPHLIVEHIKVGVDPIKEVLLPLGYAVEDHGMNLVGVPR